jgi:hypothetical protein
MLIFGIDIWHISFLLLLSSFSPNHNLLTNFSETPNMWTDRQGEANGHILQILVANMRKNECVLHKTRLAVSGPCVDNPCNWQNI